MGQVRASPNEQIQQVEAQGGGQQLGYAQKPEGFAPGPSFERGGLVAHAPGDQVRNDASVGTRVVRRRANCCTGSPRSR